MKKIHLILAALIACILFFSGCKKEEHVVTFHPNGARGDIVTQNFTGNIPQSLMANPFTYKGFTFQSWNTKPDGTGDIYSDQETIKVSASMVLYAQWKSASGEFTVTFKANGGEGEMEPQKFIAGVAQELYPNVFHSLEYRFTGWNTSANGSGKKFENQQIITLTADMTLYAQWSRVLETFLVSFYANGGTGTMEPQAFVKGEWQKLDTNRFEREEFTFKEWNTKEDGKGDSYQDMQVIVRYSNLALYAQWDSLKRK